MKILIIAMNIGRIAPGIVAEKLIKGLSEYHDVDVLTRDYDPSINLEKVNEVIRYEYKELHPFISKKFISILSINPLDLYFAKKALTKTLKKYDLILSIISSTHYVSLIMGNEFSSKTSAKHFAHFLDAVPAPLGWLKDNFFYNGLHSFMSKNLSKVDGLFATNEKMLEYQLSTFTPNKNLIKDIIYNPGSGKMEYYKYSNSGKVSFLFAGGLYGPRRPKHVLEAFRIILKEYPDSTLEFVGTKLPDYSLSIFEPEDRKKVILHPFTRNLEPFYERATALIDIDADLPDDVFLSSKIINYISINRTIISETGVNSPSRIIFDGIPSIIQCGHDSEEIANAMREAIRQNGKMNFLDRQEVLELFGIDSIIGRINKAIGYEH